ncbi:TetR/AcrR family transcriptional regulator [Micromonospora marina]|uniref:TetR/AcrR family transcriptional regulator n=1 Tax=Micromonospora marina TaxID=307120 RepID=UPI003454947E
MTNFRGPGQRAGLTEETLLTAARQILDEEGLAALTMRTLARRLDVAPNALYSHVANKAALVDLLLDDLLSAIPITAPTAEDPRAGLLDLMTATYDTLTAHPTLVPLYLARQGARGPHALRLGGIMDDLLRRAGAEAASIPEARRVLIIHAIGSAAFTTGAADDPATDRLLTSEDARQTFTRSLRWLLNGLSHEHQL